VLCATLDFAGDARWGLYTPKLLDELMGRLKSMGIRRVYWYYYGDIDPTSYCAGRIFHEFSELGRRNIESIGEPVKAAVPFAHKHGLELYAVLKPYHTGIGTCLPEGFPEADAPTTYDENLDQIRRIGGTVGYVIPFIKRYPHTRIRRRPFKAPPNLQELAVKKIRLVKNDDSPTRIRNKNIEIWTSRNNCGYKRKDVAFTVKEAIEPAQREVRDYYGDLVTPRGAPVRTLTLEDLDLTDRYIMVTTNFKDKEGDFRNTALAILEAYGNSPAPLPVVVGTQSATGGPPRDFHTYGFDFDAGYGRYQIVLDANNSTFNEYPFWKALPEHGLIAFARGRNDYVPCAPCEAYPEVRTLWSAWVDRLIEAEVDGIDLRITDFGCLVDEPYGYGFNEPLVEEYRERFGEDLLADDADLRRLAQLRGEHYTSFVRETSKRIHHAGKKLNVHLHAEAFRPNPCPGQLMGFPANIHFDWGTWLREGLVDGATLRSNWYEALESPSEDNAQRSDLLKHLADPVVKEMLAVANETGVPVYLHRYVNRAININEYVSDIETIFYDDRFAGFNIYEVQDLIRAAPDGSRLVTANITKLDPHDPTSITEMVTDGAERIQAKSKELGIL